MTELPQVGVSDDEDVDIAVWSTSAGNPRSEDRGNVNVWAIETLAQLTLDSNGTTQKLGQRLICSIVGGRREPVWPRLVITADQAGRFGPGQLPMN